MEGETRDLAIFQLISNELPGEDWAKTNAKIKRKLRRSHLGPYEQERIDLLRALHKALREELRDPKRSKYYDQTAEGFAAPDHFDTESMVRDYLREYGAITETDLSRIIAFSVYFYYLR